MDVLRLIDANANRAREALRVMEDAARFLLNDAALSRDLKAARHNLADALRPLGDLAAHRDTPGDVGTAITTEAESRRDTPADVAVAAGKRLSEALRAIEEFVKTLPGGGERAAAFEALRYRGYELERRLVTSLSREAAPQWRLCVLFTEALCEHHGWLDVARACVASGADCLQLREKALPDRVLLERARTLIELARPAGVSVVINDRADIATLAGADGVHLGQGDLSVRDARRLGGPGLLVGVSTSRVDEAEQAAADGADVCGVGPMFPTTTAAEKTRIAGPAYLRAYLKAVKLPHLAIGGITPGNVGELVEAGARGVAVSAAVCGAKDPGAVAAEILDAIPSSVTGPAGDAAGHP